MSPYLLICYALFSSTVSSPTWNVHPCAGLRCMVWCSMGSFSRRASVHWFVLKLKRIETGVGHTVYRYCGIKSILILDVFCGFNKNNRLTFVINAQIKRVRNLASIQPVQLRIACGGLSINTRSVDTQDPRCVTLSLSLVVLVHQDRPKSKATGCYTLSWQICQMSEYIQTQSRSELSTAWRASARQRPHHRGS